MKNHVLKFYVFIAAALFGMTKQYAQQVELNCNQKVAKARILLKGNSVIAKDSLKAVAILTQCATEGNPDAQAMLGYLYKFGKAVTKNDTKAFEYTKKAALQGNSYAVCELGVMYKDGIGCKLNFDNAIEWFTKAHEVGNPKGSYSLGYMYFKGLGSVEQDYSKAVSWFQKSSYPMAKHFLGICNYFGYGMVVNKDRALELWLDNPITNSEVILEHLEANPNLLSIGNVNNDTTKATEFGVSKINEVITSSSNIEIDDSNTALLTKESLIGKWAGKLIELDWSKERIQRSFPVNLNITANKEVGDLGYDVTINESKGASYGIFLGDSFYFDKLKMKLPRLYQDDRKKYDLDYGVLSLNEIEIKEIDHVRYLIANVETSVLDWKEPGVPMLLILDNTKTLTDNGEQIDEALLEALIQAKDDSFITLYPNPFKNDLLVQYDLAEDSLTNVEIYSFGGQFMQTIVAGEQQKAGKHLYHVDGSKYPQQGLYVVRVTANNITHTKLIVKE